MATLVELQTRLTAIRRARDTGALMVRHADTQTTFRSLEEMDAIISGMISEISALEGKKRRMHYVRQESKGL